MNLLQRFSLFTCGHISRYQSVIAIKSVDKKTFNRRQYSTEMAAPDESVVSKDEMRRFMVDCMTTAGASESHATQLALVLLEGDIRGHYSHGLNRLDMYVRDVQQKVCKGDGEPVILKEKAGTAWVDGNNLLGPVVGNFCMDLAIKKAKDAGIGWVVAKGSNHYGIAGWYALRAMKQGMLGMSMTNTSPISYPTRSAVPALGTNPISLAAPGTGDDAFVLDMASTTVAIGKVELAARKENPVPLSWGVGAGGKETTDPSHVLNGGGLLPLGGVEVSGGYKGYGLSSMIEIFCGILAGAHWGPHVRKWMSTSAEADLGQCFVAIDPEAFAPGFAERLQDFMQTMRALPTSSPSFKVEVAGDMERRHELLVNDLGGIPYHKNQIAFVNDLASKLGVKPVALVQ
ncbi:hypothetical protein CRE_02254 [Caenorhabditis remanei]|uniref:Uncharacterized protein n=2 Tax=Caenorhabditis remanei TaxID=31234 RepID=E3LFW8_CAERE|nr:hypothetical protein CRE_02254 [Caenorhabditis remanei]